MPKFVISVILTEVHVALSLRVKNEFPDYTTRVIEIVDWSHFEKKNHTGVVLWCRNNDNASLI